jgi:hypothetical protein
MFRNYLCAVQNAESGMHCLILLSDVSQKQLPAEKSESRRTIRVATVFLF